MVTTTDSVTSIMVKRRYLPRSGTARDVGGMISASSKKNTVSDSRMLMDKLTYCKIYFETSVSEIFSNFCWLKYLFSSDLFSRV